MMFQQQTGEVGWDLVSMWHNMGIPAKAVVFILFVMSAWSVGIMIDRALMYSAARKQSRDFRSAGCGRAERQQARRSDFHRRAQQEEPHRQGRGHRASPNFRRPRRRSATKK